MYYHVSPQYVLFVYQGRILNKVICFLTLSLVSVFSVAATKTFTVAGVGISANTNTIFLNVEQDHGHSSCTNQRGFRFSATLPLYKEVYATLLTAKVSKKSIEINYDDSNRCVYNSPIIKSVYIK